VIAATFGVVLAAVYLLKMLQLTLWGPLTKDENRQLADLGAREKWLLVPLCALMLWIGVAPRFFLDPSRAALEAILGDHNARLATTSPAAPSLRPVPSAPSAALGLGSSSAGTRQAAK
jgi:NADH-quinone oxidoreductase subunit M